MFKETRIGGTINNRSKYIAAATTINQVIWLRKLLCDLGQFQESPIKILCDNKSSMLIAKNLVFHGRTKHFKIKFHLVRETKREQEVFFIHCKSEDQFANILTKSLSKFRFEQLKSMIGLCNKDEFYAK